MNLKHRIVVGGVIVALTSLFIWLVFIPRVELKAGLQFGGGVWIENLDEQPWRDVRVRIRTGFRNEMGWMQKTGTFRAELATLRPGSHISPPSLFRSADGRILDLTQRVVLSKRIRARIGTKVGSWSD